MLIIHKLIVENFAGVSRAVLELQDSGVTVLYGPNEAGKSTMLNAFKLLMNDTKVTSGAKAVKQFYPRHRDENPHIVADLTIGRYRLTMDKFYKSGTAGKATLRISEPAVETIPGEEGEKRFQEIVKSEVDTTLLGALTIEQGSSLDDFTASTVSSLASAMAQASGGETVTAEDLAANNVYASDLLAAIEAEYRKYYTPTGAVAAKSDLRVAELARNEAREELDRANATYREAQQYIDALDRLESDSVDVQEQLPAAREEVEAKEAAFKVAESVAAKLDGLRTTLTNAEQGKTIADQRWEARSALIEQVEMEEQAAKTALVKLQVANASYEEERLGLQAQQNHIEQLDSALARAKQARSAAHALVTRANIAQRLVDDSALAKKLDESESTIASLKEKLDGNAATSENIQRFRDALSSLASATRVRDLVATNVHIDGPVNEEITVDSGDKHLLGDSGVDLRVTAQQAVSLGDYTVTITPSQDQAETQRQVDRAREEVDEISRILGVESGDSDAAERSAEQRARWETELVELKYSSIHISGGRSLESLRRDIEVAEGEWEQADAAVRNAVSREEQHAAPSEVDGHPLIAQTAEVVKSVLALAEHQQAIFGGIDDVLGRAAALAEHSKESQDDEVVQATERAVDAVETALRTASQRSNGASDVAKAFFTAEAHSDTARKTADKSSATLLAAREDTSDEVLTQAITDAQAAIDAARTALEAACRENEGTDLDSARDLLLGARSRVQQLENRARAIGEERAAASARLEGRANAAELRDKAQSAVDKAEADHDRVASRAAAAKLLRETVIAARNDMQARYEGPFKKTFESLAQAVYGMDVSFELDDNLGVSQRIVDGVGLDPAQLSGGAREQMLILARIAVATLVGGGEAVPIFIDDALGFSDPHRIERMNAVLGKLGKQHQVIVLTCDVERFDSIPGADQRSIQSIQALA